MRRGLLVALALLGCEGADLDPGRALTLRVPGAQSARGRLIAGSGPAITLLDVRTPTLAPGTAEYRLSGRVVDTAAAVHLAAEGDDRYWIVPTGLPDPTVPAELGFSVRFDLRRDLPAGPLAVRMRAVDAAGRPGPVEVVDFMVGPATPSGALVVRLEWDTPADLDLYVIDPAGHRLGPDDPNTYAPPPPGSPPDPPDAWRQGGILDRDAGAECAAVGPLAEHAIWAQTAPAGGYRVAVDLAGVCGAAAVPWRLQVLRDGVEIEAVSGVLYPSDARATAASAATPLEVARFAVP